MEKLYTRDNKKILYEIKNNKIFVYDKDKKLKNIIEIEEKSVEELTLEMLAEMEQEEIFNY